MIFDLLWNLGLLYIAVELFRNRRNVTNLLLYTFVAGILVEGILDIMRSDWVGVTSDVLLIIFVIYALKTRLSRLNFRIANFAMLPAFFILGVVHCYW